MDPKFKWINFYFMSSIHLIPIFFINDAKYLKHAKFLIIFVALKLLSVLQDFIVYGLINHILPTY